MPFASQLWLRTNSGALLPWAGDGSGRGSRWLATAAAADRRKEIDLAVLAHPVEQTAQAHLTVHPHGDRSFQLASFDKLGLDAGELAFEVVDDLADVGALRRDTLLAAGQLAQQRGNNHRGHKTKAGPARARPSLTILSLRQLPP